MARGLSRTLAAPHDVALMADLAILAIMLAFALLGFFMMHRLVFAQRSGAALTFVSVISAALAFFVFAGTTPIGMDPLRAIGAALVCLLPALVGAGAGALLGWLMLRRRFRK